MNKYLLLAWLIVAAGAAMAHDHVEVGEDPEVPARLGLDGPAFQLALYVPPGEPFSGYLPDFPGDWQACELTFTTEVNALNPADGANPRIEVLSISGPPGGAFGFFEVGGLSPAWLKPAGWTNGPGDTATIEVILGGENHVHGRAFVMSLPGEYTVVFRAIDTEGGYTPSVEKSVTFSALAPPPMSVAVAGGQAMLSFTSRLNLDYDLQSSTNLAAGWVTEETIFGDGAPKVRSMPVGAGPLRYFRLVEY
jgi:hypothetical protein